MDAPDERMILVRGVRCSNCGVKSHVWLSDDLEIPYPCLVPAWALRRRNEHPTCGGQAIFEIAP